MIKAFIYLFPMAMKRRVFFSVRFIKATMRAQEFCITVIGGKVHCINGRCCYRACDNASCKRYIVPFLLWNVSLQVRVVQVRFIYFCLIFFLVQDVYHQLGSWFTWTEVSLTDKVKRSIPRDLKFIVNIVVIVRILDFFLWKKRNLDV